MQKYYWPIVGLLSMGATIFSSFVVRKVDRIAQSYQRDNVRLMRSNDSLAKEVVRLKDTLSHCAFYVTEIPSDSIHWGGGVKQ